MIRSKTPAWRLAEWRISHGAIRWLKQHCVDSLLCSPRLPRAADVLLRDAKGYEHNRFKIDLAHRAIVRALTQAAAGTPQVQSSKKIA